MKTAPGGLTLKIQAQKVCPKLTLRAALDLKTSQPAMGIIIKKNVVNGS